MSPETTSGLSGGSSGVPQDVVGKFAGDCGTCETSCKRTALSLVTVSLSAAQEKSTEVVVGGRDGETCESFRLRKRFKAR